MDVDKLKNLDAMFIADGQGTEEMRSRINRIHSAFFCPQSVFGGSGKYRDSSEIVYQQ